MFILLIPFQVKCGPKHCSLVWQDGSGGDYDLTRIDENKLYRDWLIFKDFGAKYVYLTVLGKVKIYGYIRKDCVEIKGVKYNFDEREHYKVKDVK